MIEQFLLVAGITFMVMISPGPDMVIVTRNTLLGGRAAGLHTALGVLTGNLVHITYCIIGIGWLISQSILVFSLLKLAGAAYLIYLGVVGLLTTGTPLIDAELRPAVRTWYIQGFLNNILNPKGALFYLGVFTVVVTPETSVGATLVLILIMMAVSGAFWLVFIPTLGSQPIRNLLAECQVWIQRLFGGLLVILGIRIAMFER